MNPTAIIEVTENCNLACTFCLRPSFTPPVMSDSTLEKVISHILECCDQRADFVWHGGEPLLTGLKFFEKIPPLQRKYNNTHIAIFNNIQTNGTTLRREFVDFFERKSFAVGTSIQGTKDIHDSSRLTVNGKPTYYKVIKRISQLKEKPSSIVVLTIETLGREEEIYYQTKPHVRGMRVSEYFPRGINPSHCSGTTQPFEKSTERPEPLMPTSEEYGCSMTRFYETWKNDPNPIDLRPITEIIRSFVIGMSEGCLYSQEACAHSVIGVKSNGEFYTCIRGAPEQKFSLGMVDNKPLRHYSQFAETLKQERIKKLLEGSCRKCEFWDYCNGGCPLESWKLYGDLDHKTWYCEGRKILFEYILKDLQTTK